MWRVHCRLFGSSGEPRWFVVRDLLSNAATEYLNTPHGRPLPFATEEAALERADMLNAEPLSVTAEDWVDIDARR